MSFDKFISRVAIRGDLIAETGIHIGVGSSSIDPSATDSPVIRDSRGRPFIPGSSLKGAIRSHLESIVRSLSRNGFWSCDPLAEPCILPRKENGREGIEEIKERVEKQATKDNKRDQALYDRLLTAEIDGLSCTLCRLFGSPWLASHVLIKDAFVITERWGRRIELRDGVGIDRDTETARQGVKYDFEVVPATTGFNLEIMAENLDDWLMGLLAIGLREMENGRIALGGKTTRGLGAVRFAPREIETADADSLLDYLIEGRGKILKGGELHDYMISKIESLSRKLN